MVMFLLYQSQEFGQGQSCKRCQAADILTIIVCLNLKYNSFKDFAFQLSKFYLCHKSLNCLGMGEWGGSGNELAGSEACVA